MRKILVQLLLLAIFVFLTIFASLKYNTYGKIEEEIDLQEKNELLLESGSMSLEVFQSLIKKGLDSRKEPDSENESKEPIFPKIDFSEFKIESFSKNKNPQEEGALDNAKSDFMDFSKSLFKDAKDKLLGLPNLPIFQKVEEN